jgi:hypothetical protein
MIEIFLKTSIHCICIDYLILGLQSTVVTICTTCIKIRQLYILLTDYISVCFICASQKTVNHLPNVKVLPI